MKANAIRLALVAGLTLGSAAALAQATEGVGHAVDFRREGFADQGDMQACDIHGASLERLGSRPSRSPFHKTDQ